MKTSFKSVLNDESFEKILYILMQDQGEEFFINPKKVLDKNGIELDDHYIHELKNLCTLSVNDNKTAFNEKLVLCSSCGY